MIAKGIPRWRLGSGAQDVLPQSKQSTPPEDPPAYDVCPLCEGKGKIERGKLSVGKCQKVCEDENKRLERCNLHINIR